MDASRLQVEPSHFHSHMDSPVGMTISLKSVSEIRTGLEIFAVLFRSPISVSADSPEDVTVVEKTPSLFDPPASFV